MRKSYNIVIFSFFTYSSFIIYLELRFNEDAVVLLGSDVSGKVKMKKLFS